MKNTKKREQKISPYRTVGLEKISAPYPETPSVSGKSTVAKGDLRVRGSK
jgi:hypothetical protein